MEPDVRASCRMLGRDASPPPGSEVAHLKARDLLGSAFVAQCAGLTALAILLSTSDLILLWIAGQVLLAFALLQWFAVLHECGHGGLFRTALEPVGGAHWRLTSP